MELDLFSKDIANVTNSIKNSILKNFIPIKNTYFKIQAKPYDLDVFDWIKAYTEVNKDINDKSLTIKYQKINKFWCSALVSYIYVECELLDKNIPWTIVTPNNFYYKYKFLPLLNCKLKKDKLLI